MKIYNEVYIRTAKTVSDLIDMLKYEVPKSASVSVYASEHTSDVEVWYDKEINEVILK